MKSLQRQWSRIRILINDKRRQNSHRSLRERIPFFARQWVLDEGPLGTLTKCPFYSSLERGTDVGSIGYCALERQIPCSGDFNSCRKPDGLQQYFLERGLGWRNGRRNGGPKKGSERKKRSPPADLISKSLIEYIHSLSKFLLTTVSFAATIVLGMFNRLTGPEAFSYVFYLIPISFVTWFTAKWIGLGMSVVCAFVWLLADITSRTPLSFSTIPYWNAIAKMGSFAIFTLILSSVKDVLEKERHSSRIDHLTGIRNRKHFIELAEFEILRAERNKSFFTVIYIDLDNFKSVNDRFGHLVGDNLLRLVSRTIQRNIRDSDTVARLGGDEFAILLPETGPEVAELITRRIQKSGLEAMKKHEWPVTFSIGQATFAGSSLTVDEVLKKSDDLMYNAKRAGKNTIRQDLFAREIVA